VLPLGHFRLALKRRKKLFASDLYYSLVILLSKRRRSFIQRQKCFAKVPRLETEYKLEIYVTRSSNGSPFFRSSSSTKFASNVAFCLSSLLFQSIYSFSFSCKQQLATNLRSKESLGNGMSRNKLFSYIKSAPNSSFGAPPHPHPTSPPPLPLPRVGECPSLRHPSFFPLFFKSRTERKKRKKEKTCYTHECARRPFSLNVQNTLYESARVSLVWMLGFAEPNQEGFIGANETWYSKKNSSTSSSSSGSLSNSRRMGSSTDGVSMSSFNTKKSPGWAIFLMILNGEDGSEVLDDAGQLKYWYLCHSSLGRSVKMSAAGVGFASQRRRRSNSSQCRLYVL